MVKAGKYDQAKLLADAQAIVKIALPIFPKAPVEIQNQLINIDVAVQSIIQSVKAKTKVDPKATEAVVAAATQIEASLSKLG